MPLKELDSQKINRARREFTEALEGLKEIHTHEDLEIQRELVKEARQRLWDVSDEFRREVQARADASRVSMRERHSTETGTRGFKMPGMAPIAPVRLPKVMAAEIAWVCLECGTANVNYEQIKGRKKQRRFVKRYIMMMKALDMPLELKEAMRIIKRGIPYCIMCSQKLGRSVYMVKRPLREVQTIKNRKHERKVSSPIKTFTKKQRKANIEKQEKRKSKAEKPRKRKKKA